MAPLLLTAIAMLLYDSGNRVRNLFQLRGGVFFQHVPLGVAVGLVTLFVNYLHVTGEDQFFPAVGLGHIKGWHSYLSTNDWGPKTFGVVISFAIVFRIQYSINRYWEASREVQVMFGKWADVTMQLLLPCVEDDVCGPAANAILFSYSWRVADVNLDRDVVLLNRLSEFSLLENRFFQ